VAATSSGCKTRKSTSTIGFVAKTQGRYVNGHKLVGKPNMSTLLHVMSLVLSPTPLLTLPTVTSGEKELQENDHVRLSSMATPSSPMQWQQTVHYSLAQFGKTQ
jgi:hypothetical protein